MTLDLSTFAPPFYGRDPRAEYIPEPGLISALKAAITLGMPLLLTGDPGCGKTDFAFAVARKRAADRPDWRPTDAAGDGLLECYVRSDTRAVDLLYHYDALRRFGDANHRGPTGAERAADARLYIELMPLGIALAQMGDPLRPRRRVVLIDEIDKAPRDLPNDLLRELDQGCFEIKELPDADELARIDAAVAERPTVRSHGIPLRRRLGLADPSSHDKPVIIITSNEERQLPDAFLRRCVFHHVTFPEPRRLARILKARFAATHHDAIPPAVKAFTALRQQFAAVLLKKPSTSELIAWFEALITPDVYPGGVATVRRFADGITPGKDKQFRLTDARLSWRDLPGLGCLLKLKADWDRLPAGA